MKFVFFTNKGQRRERNKGALFAVDSIVSNCNMIAPTEINTRNYNRSYSFVVVDGIGGYGTEAAEKAANIVAMSFWENSEGWRNISSSEAKNEITSILTNATERIIYIAKNSPELSRMGAVCAGVVFCRDNILIFNCGDCRVYGQQGRSLEQLSRDHSIVIIRESFSAIINMLTDLKEGDDRGLCNHFRKSIVTSCISTNADCLDIFFREVSYGQEYKRLFICSGGVWDALSADGLEECFCENSFESANNITEKLKKRCDYNVSFIIIDTENIKPYSL